MVVYTVQRGEVGLQSTYRRCRFLQKKTHLFRWSWYWSWWICGIENPSHTFKSRRTQFRGIIGPFFFENEQGENVVVDDDRYRTMLNGYLLKRRILATFGVNRTALRATQPKLHPMFFALLLKIAFSAAELMSFGHLVWLRFDTVRLLFVECCQR